MNNYDYGLYNCWHCLCEVCTRIGCPKAHRRTKFSFCIALMQREACPTIKCDYFEHRQKVHIFRVVAKHKRIDRVMLRFNDLEQKIDQLLKLNIDVHSP